MTRTQYTARNPTDPKPKDSDFAAVGWEGLSDWKEIPQTPPQFDGSRVWKRDIVFTAR